MGFLSKAELYTFQRKYSGVLATSPIGPREKYSEPKDDCVEEKMLENTEAQKAGLPHLLCAIDDLDEIER